MASSTDICNLALGLLRGELQITNLTTEQTTTARKLRVVYPLKQQELLRARAWSFTKATATLAVLAQNPTPVWAFSYALPGDCIFARRILGVTANTVGTLSYQVPSNALVEIGNLYAPQVDSNSSVIRFEVAKGVLYTNQPNAILEYSQNVTTEGSYPPKFVWALAYAVAAEIAPSLANGDPFQMGPRLASEAKRRFEECCAEEMNQRVAMPPDAEAIRAYGGWTT